ncbi:hypothetical protein PIB30_043855 [Stylosanthes scabra]|uniref:Uncharacterized protein n=1 Tax=Stylosanthes scabra TaxID=79078 RepID=A0ABU6YG03_9FABA|nr:hypothetical protein [Stylosanthes scabra]
MVMGMTRDSQDVEEERKGNRKLKGFLIYAEASRVDSFHGSLSGVSNVRANLKVVCD